MFLTYILNSIGVLVHLTQVVPKIEYVNSDPVRTALFVFNSVFKYVAFVTSWQGAIVCKTKWIIWNIALFLKNWHSRKH